MVEAIVDCGLAAISVFWACVLFVMVVMVWAEERDFRDYLD